MTKITCPECNEVLDDITIVVEQSYTTRFSSKYDAKNKIYNEFEVDENEAQFHEQGTYDSLISVECWNCEKEIPMHYFTQYILYSLIAKSEEEQKVLRVVDAI